MKNLTVHIDSETIRKIEKGNRRQAMIDEGVYNIHKEKTYRDVSKYSRKDKHKISWG
jgi:hypothetical protein